ncbi:hypothetical protein B0H14DRAFT_3151823 [Mycena olivaceomarginata]|nr:hypothetical protein B0H14DRAFT_3151823 [Mycena olivaceomarginata]
MSQMHYEPMETRVLWKGCASEIVGVRRSRKRGLKVTCLLYFDKPASTRLQCLLKGNPDTSNVFRIKFKYCPYENITDRRKLYSAHSEHIFQVCASRWEKGTEDPVQ